jgi:TIR domain
VSRIFLSHSSTDNAEAIAIRDWMIKHGWDDVFLDTDPRGLKAGERWQKALKQAAEHCEMVVCLVSPNWVRSSWCRTEFLLAQTLNKRIFAVIVEPTPFSDLPTEIRDGRGAFCCEDPCEIALAFRLDVRELMLDWTPKIAYFKYATRSLAALYESSASAFVIVAPLCTEPFRRFADALKADQKVWF